ncbi:helix-turn-helix domain-containing protein [Salinibacter ruber]|mgnify:CR=1 FL=1|uniref:helix-turn-helix domain-containing protein n=1 Tax=Salinibacter ruber TaxID=146919 RepID=UPI002342E674
MSVAPKERIQQAFGDSLRSARLDAELSQEELAHRAKLDRSYVGSVERGERNISLENIVKLSRALEISLADLFADFDP